MYIKRIIIMILIMGSPLIADTKLQQREKRVETVREKREKKRAVRRAKHNPKNRRFVRVHGKPSYQTPTAAQTRVGGYGYTQPTNW